MAVNNGNRFPTVSAVSGVGDLPDPKAETLHPRSRQAAIGQLPPDVRRRGTGRDRQTHLSSGEAAADERRDFPGASLDSQQQRPAEREPKHGVTTSRCSNGSRTYAGERPRSGCESARRPRRCGTARVMLVPHREAAPVVVCGDAGCERGGLELVGGLAKHALRLLGRHIPGDTLGAAIPNLP